MKRWTLRALCVAAVIAVACMMFLYACSNGSSNARRQAAETGLGTLRGMADGSESVFFGYASPSDVGSEELGDPIEIRTVDVDRLLSGESANDSMIVDQNEYLFPVVVRDRPVGSIQIMLDEDGWEYVAIRSRAEVERVIEIVAARALRVEDIYLLDLAEIETVFVGYQSDGRHVLIPLFSGSSLPLDAGVQYPFTEIADFLKEAVRTARNSYENMVPPNAGDLDEAGMRALEKSLRSSTPAFRETETDTKTRKILNLDLYPQEQDEWCWAATGRMTMLFAGGDSRSITQCAQANAAFGQDSCCVNGATQECNNPHYPRYDQWDFAAREVFRAEGAALSWNALKALIDSGKPVAFLWRWKGGGGHYMAAVGYYEDRSKDPAVRMVLVNDPWPPNVGVQKSMTYEKWVGGPRFNNLQTCYYFDIRKK